jgi:hypothetical protein
MFLGVPESVTLSACTEQAEKQHVTSTNGKQYWCGCGTHAQMKQAQHGTHAFNHTGGSSRGWAGPKTGILASVLRGKRVYSLWRPHTAVLQILSTTAGSSGVIVYFNEAPPRIIIPTPASRL